MNALLEGNLGLAFCGFIDMLLFKIKLVYPMI